MKTIAVIDKYPIIRTGLGLFLKNSFEEFTVLESESLDRFEQHQAVESPDLFILGYTHDWEMNHYELMTRFKARHPDAKLIIYDEHRDFAKVAFYFNAGVTGYISKKSEMPELFKCITEVQNGKNYISNDVMEILLPKWLSPGFESKRALTRHEYEIATALVNGHKVGSIAQIMERKASTISRIKKNIFKKLNINNSMDLKRALNKASVRFMR